MEGLLRLVVLVRGLESVGWVFVVLEGVWGCGRGRGVVEAPLECQTVPLTTTLTNPQTQGFVNSGGLLLVDLTEGWRE